MTVSETDPADLDLVDAVRMLHERTLSARELVEACRRRIRERDGSHSLDGDPRSVNAWIRLYDQDAQVAASRCDERLSASAARRGGAAPLLCGVPVALKDTFAVAGKPLTASSQVLAEVPPRSCDVWVRLESAGALLLGHVHTHEFAAGATTDQVGNPWELGRSAGGSSGGSAAALAAQMVPAAMGSDTAGSLRVPSALCGTCTIKPTRGLVSLAGVVPLAASLDHVGPMARTVADCAVLLRVVAGPDRGDATTAFSASYARTATTAGPQRRLTVAVSPRMAYVEVDPDVGDGFETALSACRQLGWRLTGSADGPTTEGVDPAFWRLQGSEILAYHRRFDGIRDRYRPSTLQLVEAAEHASVGTDEYLRIQVGRRGTTESWQDWLTVGGIDAIIEPTVPVIAPSRGRGYQQPEISAPLLSLTHLWNWTGFPVVALPAGIGARSGLPVGVSLIGRPGADGELLRAGAALQSLLGTPRPPWPPSLRPDPPSLVVRRSGSGMYWA